MSVRPSPKLIGAFVLVAVALATAGLVAFGSGRLFSTTYRFISVFNTNVSGLRAGAPVKFRGVEIGRVIDVRINIEGLGRQDEPIGIPVIYEIDEGRLVSRGGSAALLQDPDSIAWLIDLGLRAQLVLESFVTGRRYVGLDLLPDTAVDTLETNELSIAQIPVVSTGFEELEQKLHSLVAQLDQVRLDSMVASFGDAARAAEAVLKTPEIAEALARLPGTLDQLDSTLSGFASLAAAADSGTGPLFASLDGTAEETRRMVTEMRQVINALEGQMSYDSPLMVQLERTLIELQGTARALRNLAQTLERSPNAVVRGKPDGDQ